MRHFPSRLSVKISSALIAASLCSLAVSAAGPAFAQTPAKQNCQVVQTNAAANKAEPATQPDRTSADGTAPGNAGSTGWTGGTGGAHIGTNPQGATEHSTTWQPPTARGLDLALELPASPPPSSC